MQQLTNEEIVRVFAIYWGQEILMYEGDKDRYPVNRHNIDCKHLYLDLKPLSGISDEDAIDVAKIVTHPNWRVDNVNPIIFRKDSLLLMNTQGYKMVTIFYDGTIMYKDRDGVDCYTKEAFNAYQYLISKGYAVPLFFAPNHWANDKTAIELGVAIDKSKSVFI